MQEKELVFYIQGNYGYGWEDLSGYPCGIKRKNYKDAKNLCLRDYREYCFSGTGAHRIIKRYEKIEE